MHFNIRESSVHSYSRADKSICHCHRIFLSGRSVICVKFHSSLEFMELYSAAYWSRPSNVPVGIYLERDFVDYIRKSAKTLLTLGFRINAGRHTKQIMAHYANHIECCLFGAAL